MAPKPSPLSTPTRVAPPIVLPTRNAPSVGDLRWTAATVAGDVDGWLVCDGREMSATTYPALFARIGMTYGGDTSRDVFCLPDARGRVLAASSSLHPVGSSVGSESHALTIDEMPSHIHTTLTSAGGTHAHTMAEAVGEDMPVCRGDDPATTAWVRRGTTSATTATEQGHTHEVAVNSTGSGQPHGIMQPTLFLGAVLMYAGV
jgi:microcystin-dependent protein